MTDNITHLPIKPKSSVPSSAASARLAQELAAGLTDPEDLLERFGLSKSQFRRITKSTAFRKMYKRAKEVWDDIDNTEERIRTKSLYLLEDSILPLYGIIHNADLAPAARIEAFAKLMKISNMEPKKEGEGSGSNFTVTINIPGEEKVVI